MKQLLIINKTQFGYHTDYYKYCKYLKEEFNITYLSFDAGHKKLKMEGVDVTYVPWEGPKLIRGLLFVLTGIFTILKHKGPIFIHYFEYCFILKKIFPWKKMILDIRTLSVHSSLNSRKKHNSQLKKTCAYFDFITIISDGIREKINIDKSKSAILPLGSDVISQTNKKFSDIRLLYVGTLNGRNLSDTIKGLDLFLQKSDYNGKINYDIVGDGEEFESLQEIVKKRGLYETVNLHGMVPHFELKSFFDKCNIGVSYIPMTDYFDYQPPTKTFEYILSGLVCIATKTHANKLLINSVNGVLHKDTPKSFSNALQKIIANEHKWNSDTIRATLKGYTWENIVNSTLVPVIKENMT